MESSWKFGKDTFDAPVYIYSLAVFHRKYEEVLHVNNQVSGLLVNKISHPNLFEEVEYYSEHGMYRKIHNRRKTPL